MVIGKNRPGYVLSAVILSVLPFAGEAGADARDHGTQVEVIIERENQISGRGFACGYLGGFLMTTES